MRFEEVKLEELCTIQRGASPRPIKDHVVEKGIPWVKIADATADPSRYISKTKEFIKVESKSKSRPVKKGDLILSNSATPGLPKIMKIDACIHDGWLLLRDFKGVSKEYLYYVLINKRRELVSNATGTVFNNLKTDTVKNFKIQLPDKVVQSKITNILQNFDEKIDTNIKIISNLEELAQTLFKHWFVDFEFPDENGQPYKSNGGKMIESEMGMIPEGWGVKKIKELPIEVSDHVANGSFKGLKENVKVLDTPDYALFLRNIDLKSNLQNKKKYVDKSSYEFLKKSRLYGGEVIISNVGDVGTVHKCPSLKVPMVLGNNLIYINPLENMQMYNTYFYLFFTSTFGQSLINTITSGSVQMKFNKTDFRNLKCVFPNTGYLYLNIFSRLLNHKEELIQENKNLQDIRDSLLPKLLSGEVELTADMEVNEDVPVPGS